MIDPPIITLDIDWSPDFIIRDVSEILTKNNVRATWLITHKSPILHELQKNSLFELGIHPNFLPNSTQGDDPDSILKNLMNIVPKAKSIRTHELMQHGSLLLKFKKYGIENDLSLFLEKTRNLEPHFSNFYKLYRFPCFWSDAAEIVEDSNWSLDEPTYHVPGLKIFCFHPIHIYLNTRNWEKYNLMKNTLGYSSINEKTIEEFINKNNPGTRTFFEEIVSLLRSKKSFTIADLRKNYDDFFKNGEN